jgi:hemerythrin-like metal-binding protein
MWHTYYSTGDRQIDEDHANIDFLLDLCASCTDEWQERARVILDAFARHMDTEERICEERRLNMTEEHRGEHIYLRSKLREMQQQITDREIGKSVFVDFTRKMLLFHVSYFDLDLLTAP